MTSHATNAVEQAVEDTYNALLRTVPGLCSCERCKDDIITLALNDKTFREVHR